MADSLVKGLQFIVEFEEGDKKSLNALKKKITSKMKELETTLNAQEAELASRLDSGAGTKRVEARIQKTKAALKELGEAQEWVSRSLKDYIALEQKLKDEKKEQTKEQIKFNKALAEEKKLRDATLRANLDAVKQNRKAAQEDRKPYVLPKNYLRDRALQNELDLGRSTPIPPGYLENRILELNKGAKVNLPSDYFAQTGSINQLKNNLEQLKRVQENLAPGTREFKNLSKEISTTEKRIGSLVGKINGDGMASFRKFSHMLFNITGLFVIASRGFEGLIKSLTRGAEFDTMRQAFQGTTEDIENMRKASRGLLSDEKIFAFSNKATDLGIKIKDQPIFVDMAIRSMKAYGAGVEKLDEILEKVIKSTETAQKELSSLGLKKVDFQKKVQALSKELVQNSEKYELVNKSLEKSKKHRKDYLLELDAEDQKTIKVNALLSLYGKTLKDVTEIEQTRSDKILSINARWENFTNTMSQKLLPVADKVFPLMTGFMDYVSANANRMATAIGVIAAALAGLSVIMIGTGNPLGVLFAGLGAVVSLMIALETAYPTASSKILNANTEITTSIKDIEGAERNLAELKAQTQDKITKAQYEEIEANEILLKQAKEKLRSAQYEKFSAFNEKATDARTGNLDRYQNIKSGLLGYVSSLIPVLGLLTPYLVMTSKNAEYVAENLKKAGKEANSFRMEILNAIKDSVEFGQVNSVTADLSWLLRNNVGLAEDLQNRFITLGSAGKAAFWGINSGILQSENAMRQFAHVNELFTKAIKLSQNPETLEMASSLFAAISGAISGFKNAFNSVDKDTEPLPGYKTSGRTKKGQHDLQTWQEQAQMVADSFKAKEDIKKSILELLDKKVAITDSKVTNLLAKLDTVGINGKTALEKLKSLDINQIYRTEEEKEKLTEAEKVQRLEKNITDEIKLQNDFITESNLGLELRARLSEKIVDEMRSYSEQLAQTKIPETSRLSRLEAINKVAESMRDASLPWNKGIPKMMTFFEMAEIGVHSLAETITSQLGKAWDDVFGEANSLLEMFLKTAATKILDSLLNRGIGLLLSSFFPGVGTILGAGLNSFVAGSAAPPTPSLGDNRPNTNGYMNRAIGNDVNRRLQMGTPYIVNGRIAGKDLKLTLDRYNVFNSKLIA